MGIREALNKHPAVAVGTAVIFSSLFLFLGIRSWRPGAQHPVFPDRCYFSTDDGATWFADNASNVPPYNHDGKQAVQAMVFTCNGGRTKWVQYLQKYTDDARAGALALQAGQELPHGTPGPLAGIMVKSPGPGPWVPESSPQARQIMTPRCPDGSSGPAALVVP